MLKPVRIASLATAVPPHVLERDSVAIEAKRIFTKFGDEYTRMASIFESTSFAAGLRASMVRPALRRVEHRHAGVADQN